MKSILTKIQILGLLIALPALANDDVGLHKSSAQPTRAVAVHKLGVCMVINDPADIFPTGDADTYLAHYMHQDYFSRNPDGSLRTDTSIRIIDQPKHGRLVKKYPDPTDYEKNFSQLIKFEYQYIPDVDYADFDHFVMEAKAGGITVQIYYTMSISLPGEPTYILDENGQKTDDLTLPQIRMENLFHHPNPRRLG